MPFSYFCFIHFFFRKTENFYVSTTERLKQGGKNEIKSNVNKTFRKYLLCMRKAAGSVNEEMIKTDR